MSFVADNNGRAPVKSATIILQDRLGPMVELG
jgi:hypothetical protein